MEADNKKYVWVIEEGSYSDYHVVGIFSTEENAKLISDALGTDAATQWELDPGVDAVRKGYDPYHVMMLRDGTTENVEKLEWSEADFGTEIRLWKRSRAIAYKKAPDVLMCTVWAKDEQHAVKICNEHRAMMIARGEWT